MLCDLLSPQGKTRRQPIAQGERQPAKRKVARKRRNKVMTSLISIAKLYFTFELNTGWEETHLI